MICNKCFKEVVLIKMEDGSDLLIDKQVTKRVVVNGSLTKGAIRYTAVPHSSTCKVEKIQSRDGTKARMANEPKRIGCQKNSMLKLFRERKYKGVWTSELAAIARKYSARISELRGEGHDIVLVEKSKKGNNRYVLMNH